ncbi:TPA: 1-acyl-sn-glycerol-3-phosphate acyltransferase [bacterium]|nr:1-acyl-sn-glycerol-3-phosphate acyltransferase [bacterium]
MLYNILRIIVSLLSKLLFRLKIKGRENIPRTGGVLICSNHLSNLDPVIIGAAVPRSLHYMAKWGLFRNPVFGRLITILHAFPIHQRGFCHQAFNKIQNLLESGKAVVLYPEGTRSKDGRLGPAKAGVGMIISKTKRVCVVPARIIGTDRALPVGGLFIRPYPIEIHFGKPLYFETPDPPSKERYMEIAQTIMTRIEKL